MKLYLNVLICVFLFSCKNKKVENSATMETNVRTFINDKAFKENYKLNIIELKSYGCDTVNENYIDTLKIVALLEKYNHFEKLAKSSLELAQLNTQQLRLYSMLGSKTLNDISKEDLQKNLKKVEEYKDSMTKYHLLDSTIRNRINQRKNPELIYKTKFFIKATATKEGKDENMLDTLFIHFDKNLKIIDLTSLN